MGFKFLKFDQSTLTRAILLLLALTFIIGFGYVGGINLGGGGTGGGTAVEVNGEKVSYAQFKNLQDSLRRQYTQNMDEVPPQIQDFIKFSALNNIVELKLLSQKATDLGLRVTKDELANAITSNPAFQVDGVFVGKENYSEFITKRLHQTVADFEQSYKEELLARKLISIINESAKVTDEELLNLYKTQNEKLSLNYVEFSPEDFISSVNPDEREIKDYYEQNKDNYLTSEQRKIEYAKLKVDTFIPMVKVSDEELKAYYDAYPEEFEADGKVLPYEDAIERVQAILVSKKAENEYKQFASNFDAGKVKDLKQIPEVGSSENISTSDFFAESDKNTNYPPTVIERAFTLNKGELATVNSDTVTWVFKVAEIKEPHEKGLAAVRDEIVSVLKEQKAKELARVSAEESLKKFINSSNNFTGAAKSLGLDVRETKFFTRVDGPEEIKSSDVAIDAFQTGSNNPLINKVYESNGNFYIASLNDKKEINKAEFEENKYSVKEREITRQRREILQGWLEDLRSEAKIVPNKKLFPAQG